MCVTGLWIVGPRNYIAPISLNRVLEFLGIVAVYLFVHIILIAYLVVCFSSCLAAVRGVSPLRLRLVKL